ncbi:MAG: hypothetical protein C4589_06220 [Peptococcaceae bacterium]|nr:MAG: hypothetical protein C4589_06220 [Peptococcaceae bacterium]
MTGTLRSVAGKGFYCWRKMRSKLAVEAILGQELRQLVERTYEGPCFLTDFRKRTKPVFFINKKNFESFKAFLSPENVIADAEAICAHEFDLLGSGRKKVDGPGGEIDWHTDFKTGASWDPSLFYLDVPVNRGDGSDIKVPWELSRFQHLPTLGKAYWLTGDERYAREFTAQAAGWLAANPPLYGVNWGCPMDAAIRAVNWLWGYYFFKDSPAVTDEFLSAFLKSLFIHGRYIMVNLERSMRGRSGNHYLADLAGLVYLGVLLPEFKEAGRWRECGVRGLIREMEEQVHPDGVSHEGSTGYHRLVAELFLSATLLGLKNGIDFPARYMKRLEKMVEFVLHYTSPGGTAPQFGDSDDGRLHILAGYGNWDRRDHRHLLSTGAVLFKRPDFRQAAGGLHEETLWLTGEEGLQQWKSLPAAPGCPSSRAFPHGGFYILRKDDFYLILDALPADPGAPPGHRHNSRLSFELCACGEPFIIDPGTYVYTADKDMRNFFRSTACHNTVVVDGVEQSRLEPDLLFRLGGEAAARVNAWEENERYVFWDGEHAGYIRLPRPVIHRRRVWFDKKERFWLLKDELTGEGTHRYELFFHFASLAVRFCPDHPGAVAVEGEKAGLAVVPLRKEGLSAEILPGRVSCRYGVKKEAPVLRYGKEGPAPLSFITLLYPFR